MFYTKLETLFNYPSKLTKLIMESPDISDGSFFVDRDAKFFRFILNFLRDHSVILPPKLIEKQQMLIEAKFYEIEPLIDLLTEAINKQINNV